MERGRRRAVQALAGSGVAAALVGLGGLTGCGSRRALKGRPVPAGARVLALGDSLTFGTGATPETAYPAVLGELSGWEVINAGVPGDTSAQALARLPALLEQHKPALVLLSIGGNDLLRRQPEDTLRENIRRIVSLVQAAEGQVLLVAIPRPTIAARVTSSLDDHPLYGELSEALKVPLHRRGWSDVLQDAQRRSDDIHANAQGYRDFANGLMATLRAAGFKA
ncbi:MAG: GDSL-type esterase/lipase family protein [Rubrivivax sp.]|jgi:acyl-CoA thioesterase-1|nr:GDSL-type esterase/lipase family protein [Rubrivivax sp.]